ncbi:MAG TPA: S41 family peptidase [Bacteroidales bacterium]|nr:S41 family peptidase [Bacteroidales bacterium]
MRKSLLIFLAYLFLIPVVAFPQQTNRSDPKETSQKIAATLFFIENFYLDTVNTPRLTEQAIIGMLKELDPHSSYLSKKEVDAANEPLEGSFEGIGVTFQLFNDTILIVSPVPGGPSDKLGIQAGDKIIRINGEDAFGSKVNNNFVMERLRGKRGTTVNVSILRQGRKDLIEYTITRDKIPINSIDATFMLSDKTGFIKLNRFSKTTMEEFSASMQQLRKQGMENLILDLRNNSGGFLNTAVELSDEFLPAGSLVVYTEGRNSPRQDFFATARGDFEKGRLVVLINEASASASEIVSGAVQDSDRGLVIGRRSFGKGLVQRPFQLPDGSVIRLTTARYHTPTGRSIQRPYEDGNESYFRDMQDRVRRGEHMHADSIHFPDSLKYFTPNGRIVYGGGGIMPDIFIPFDSTQYTDYYSNLIRRGVFNRFTLEYANRERNRLKKTYPRFEQFKTGFEVSDAMMNDFLAMARNEKVEWNEEQYKLSQSLIREQIKALIARNIWDMSAYWEITSQTDETVQKALEILRSENFFSLLKK